MGNAGQGQKEIPEIPENAISAEIFYDVPLPFVSRFLFF
jgi:hypothetical protein